MAPTILILADRIRVPLSGCSERSLLHPAVQLDRHARSLDPTDRVMVLVGFRKEAVISSHPQFLYLVNPRPTVDRTLSSYRHCLAFTSSREDLLILESDSYLASPEFDALAEQPSSCLLRCPRLSVPRERTTNMFIKAHQRTMFDELLHHEHGSTEAFLAALASVLPCKNTAPPPFPDEKLPTALSSAWTFDFDQQ